MMTRQIYVGLQFDIDGKNVFCSFIKHQVVWDNGW